MAIVTLSQVKAHLRITQNAEDDILGIYIDAAEQWICNYIDEPDITDDDPAFIQAAFLLVGDFYQNREASIGTDIKENLAVVSLLHPFRKKLGI